MDAVRGLAEFPVGRTRLQGIEQKEAVDYYDHLAKAARTLLEIDAERRPSFELWIDGILGAISRLTVRLPEDRLEDAIDIAVEYYRSPWMQRRWAASFRTLGDVFRRAAYAATPALVSRWIPKIIALPVPGEAELDAAHDAQWPEPLSCLALEERAGKIGAQLGQIRERVGRLISFVRDDSPTGRSHAGLRLMSLAAVDLLTPNQAEEFGEALWSQLGERRPSSSLQLWLD